MDWKWFLKTDQTSSRRSWMIAFFPRALLLTLLANTLIAALLTLIAPGTFTSSLVHSHAIGLSILVLAWTFHLLRGEESPRWWVTFTAILLGALIGTLVTRLWETGGSQTPLWHSPRALLEMFATALVFGAAISYYFHAQALFAMGRMRFDRERLLRLENQQRLTETELKLLQAQIEPHFLFNTLSNVVQLIDSDPPGAKRMLLNLTSYLRASLRRTRAGETTLGEELDLVRAYLEIQAVRMGPRLAYRLDCPAELRELALPPLLLQPLVENAVRHGLSPRPEGGEVGVRVAREGETLLLEVNDTGVGLTAESPTGVGLSNVRDRIRAISRGLGSMVIQPNTPGGLCVRIVLPLGSEPRQRNAEAAGGRE
jgi:signal transduction histidine kinase